MNNGDPIAWTGERFIPNLDGNIAFEHLHRYAIASLIARGKVVLDIASGEGYGSRLLSSVAKHVTGIDIDAQSVLHASQKYAATNVRFQQGSCLEIPCADASFDVVVSFETLEHVTDHDRVYREFRRVLVPTGMLIISCPEKAVYSDASGYSNPFHEHELYTEEFIQLNRSHFQYCTFMQQKIAHGSVIGPIDAGSQRCEFVNVLGNASELHLGPRLHMPMYNLAICSNAIACIPVTSIFEGLSLHTDLELAVKALRAHAASD